MTTRSITLHADGLRVRADRGDGSVMVVMNPDESLNEADPQVFCGSSNLAQGGEADGGDNVLAGPDAATPWWSSAFDPANITYRERPVFLG